MCRLLAVRSQNPFDPRDYLTRFAFIARNSKEYQGHGWGCSWLAGGGWNTYRNVCPVWDDGLSRFGRTTLLLAHARSAFRDEGVAVENNMPFTDGRTVFIFNGELHGVEAVIDKDYASSLLAIELRPHLAAPIGPKRDGPTA